MAKKCEVVLKNGWGKAVAKKREIRRMIRDWRRIWGVVLAIAPVWSCSHVLEAPERQFSPSSSLSSVQETAVDGVLSQTPQAQNSQVSAEKARHLADANERFVQNAAEAMGRAAANGVSRQPGMHAPSSDQVLYLMRAARYAEAAHYAPLVCSAWTESEKNAQEDARLSASSCACAAMDFVGMKARVRADLCGTSDCSALLSSLTLPRLSSCTGLAAKTLEPVWAFWRVQTQIAEGRVENAMSAIGEFSAGRGENAPPRDKVRQLALAFLNRWETAERLQFETRGISNEAWMAFRAALGRLEEGGNAFEAASMIRGRYVVSRLLGDEKNAALDAEKLILRYPATQMSLWPVLMPSIEEWRSRYSVSQRYARVKRLVSHFDYDNARRELKAMADEAEISEKWREEVLWTYARVAMTNSEESEVSGEIYRQFVDKYQKKGGAKLEEAMFGVARALSRQLKYREAIKALESYDRRFPHGKYAMRSLYLRGWYAFDLREDEAARPLLRMYAEKTSDTSVWGFYAQSFLRTGEWEAAIEAFEKIKRAGNPIVRGKALYWQAYAHHQLGNDERVRALFADLHELYPLTWYDMLAYARESAWFGMDLDAAYRALYREKDDPAPKTAFYAYGRGIAPKMLPEKSADYRQIMGWLALDEIEMAREAYIKREGAILSCVPTAERDVLRLHMTHLVESYDKAWHEVSGSVRAMSRTYPERRNPRHRMAYPQPFAPLVESLTLTSTIPKEFVYGIMLQESRFRPWQVSSADAIGALQMIPKTARFIAEKLGLNYHPDTFFDPKVGFVYSVYYMEQHNAMWGGNLAFTAGSYNGGPHRIGPWAIRDAGKTLDIIVDEFSFDESRHYTRKVSEHALRFAYLYAPNAESFVSFVHALMPVEVPEILPREHWGI